MNHIHWSLFLQLVSISTIAQDSHQTSAKPGNNIFTLSRQEGFDMILFEQPVWDRMVYGTKYITAQIPTGRALPVYIQISCKSSGCRTGIGFSCSIFDRRICDTLTPGIVNHENRYSSALIRKGCGGAVELLLLDRIDWISLQTGNQISFADD